MNPKLAKDPSIGWNHLATLTKRFGTCSVDNAFLGNTTLLTLALSHACVEIVEIGTQMGNSTTAFAIVADILDGHVYSMDTDPTCESKVGARLKAHGLRDRWTFTAGRSQDQPARDADFLYVDGDHRWPAVAQDMAIHGTRVRDGGLIVLDDFHAAQPGKVRWVREAWDVVCPVLLGPYAVIVMRPEYRDLFRRINDAA